MSADVMYSSSCCPLLVHAMVDSVGLGAAIVGSGADDAGLTCFVLQQVLV
jgi:hypothetical protein